MICVLWSGIEPRPSALGTWSLKATGPPGKSIWYNVSVTLISLATPALVTFMSSVLALSLSICIFMFISSVLLSTNLYIYEWWWWWRWWCLSAMLCLTLCDPIWTAGCQAPLFMGFSRQECWMAAISSSGGSSHPRDWTHIYFMGRRILYHWATREAPIYLWIYLSLYPSIYRQTILLTQRFMVPAWQGLCEAHRADFEHVHPW